MKKIENNIYYEHFKSVKHLIQSNYNLLNAYDKKIIKTASAIGIKFTKQILMDFYPMETEDNIAKCIYI